MNRLRLWLALIPLRIEKYAYRAVGKRAPWDYACPCCDQQQWDEFWENAEVFYVRGDEIDDS